jgi:hypothetical protein
MSSLMSGGAFTPFDVQRAGCLDSPNGVNCNGYSAKEGVYLNGGPVVGGLGDGNYQFSVLAPDYQEGGFVDGAAGNLSEGTGVDGRHLLGVAPFDDTDDSKDVYILAVCEVGATSPNQCLAWISDGNGSVPGGCGCTIGSRIPAASAAAAFALLGLLLLVRGSIRAGYRPRG